MSATRLRDSSRARRVVAILIAVVLLAALAYVAVHAPGRTVWEGAGEFGTVRVVERRGVLELRTGDAGTLQSAVVPGRPLDLRIAYTRAGAIGLALVPDSARILYAGLGGGAMPLHARHVLPRATIDVAEIDPLIVDVATRWFGVQADDRLRVHVADAREHIECAPPASWDLIVLDAFSDDEIPPALTTREFLESVRSRLAEQGVVVANLWTSSALYDAMLATYHVVFGDVHTVRVPARRQNIIIARVGAQLTLDSLVARARDLEARSELGYDLTSMVERGYDLPRATRAPVLRDGDPDQSGLRARNTMECAPNPPAVLRVESLLLAAK